MVVTTGASDPRPGITASPRPTGLDVRDLRPWPSRWLGPTLESMTAQAQAGVTVLDVHECWQLLRGTEVGRLAVVLDGRPDIFPVNFAVDHGSVVIRTAPGSKLTAALEGGAVAFECDGYEPALNQAWSVVLKGSVEVLRTMQELVDSVALPLFPWHAAPKPVFLRVVPDEVTGRRFVTVDPGRWRRAALLEP